MPLPGSWELPQQKPKPDLSLVQRHSSHQSSAELAALAAKDEYELVMAEAQVKDSAARAIAKKRKLSEGKKFLSLVPQRAERAGTSQPSERTLW